MVNENNGPDAAYPGPAEQAPDTPESPTPGVDRAPSEPKQGQEHEPDGERPVDWNPPPDNPGSDQDAQTRRDNGGAKTDSLIDAE